MDWLGKSRWRSFEEFLCPILNSASFLYNSLLTEVQVQNDGRGDDTAQGDSDVQIVEEDEVALSDSQEVNEVEEVTMGNADEVMEEEVERNVRIHLEDGVRRRHER